MSVAPIDHAQELTRSTKPRLRCAQLIFLGKGNAETQSFEFFLACLSLFHG